jgi:tRNA G37 N-methylase TrmD
LRDDGISVGDYVVTGGLYRRDVLYGCGVRYVPGVLGNAERHEGVF